jgi:hypothetical protein
MVKNYTKSTVQGILPWMICSSLKRINKKNIGFNKMPKELVVEFEKE